MSQLKHNPKSIEQYQIHNKLFPSGPGLDVLLTALRNNPSLLLRFEELVAVIKEVFPESKLTIDISDGPDELPITLSVYPEGSAPEALERFGDFKKAWWDAKFDKLREIVSINLEHPDFVTSGNPWDAFTDLIGTVEGPEDWASELDHYLYGTPKINQK